MPNKKEILRKEKVLFFMFFRYEIYQRLSGQREVEALRTQTIAEIAQYVNDHPNAKKEDLQKEIVKKILDFAQKIEKL